MKRLYAATCQLLESAANYLDAMAGNESEPLEPVRSGEYSQTDITKGPEPDELNSRTHRIGFGNES